MKIRLLTGRFSEKDGAQSPGDVITVPDEEARRLFEAGSAEPVARKAPDERETRATDRREQ